MSEKAYETLSVKHLRVIRSWWSLNHPEFEVSWLEKFRTKIWNNSIHISSEMIYHTRSEYSTEKNTETPYGFQNYSTIARERWDRPDLGVLDGQEEWRYSSWSESWVFVDKRLLSQCIYTSCQEFVPTHSLRVWRKTCYIKRDHIPWSVRSMSSTRFEISFDSSNINGK